MSLLQAAAQYLGLGTGPADLPLLAGRRQLLMGGGLVAALAARPARAAGGRLSPTQWLVNRLTFGWTPEEQALADQLGYDGYLEYHLNYTAIDDSALDAQLANLTTLSMSATELAALPAGQVIGELVTAAILRAVFSKRQLFERMVEFWTDHFNIDITIGFDRFLKTVDDREVIRQYALGSFPQLLTASARSPAMLYYLDNASSQAAAPNENYARELMELHTIGVDGGYTQTDVEEVARCFTGWTINLSGNPATRFTFLFRPDWHDDGSKWVLGNYIPPGGGISDGYVVLNILANHPSAATFIAGKLCSKFWGENPPDSLVSNVAATYTQTGGDIKAMLRTLFHDPLATPEAAPLRYKRPFHYYASSLRAVGATITNASGITTQLDAAGHRPFHWPAPNGYPDVFAKWVGLILPRWNFNALLCNSKTPGLTGTNWSTATFFQGVQNTADASASHINNRLFGGQMDADDYARIRDYMLPNPPTNQRKREAVGLALSSPGFQWY